MLTIQHVEEDLSKAYVQALAARARISLHFTSGHDYSVDGHFSHLHIINGHIKESGFQLDFQLKASKNIIAEKETIKYDLDAETFNYLVTRLQSPKAVPFILIVLELPKNEDDWLFINEEELILRKCCYWYLPGTDMTLNNSTKRIEIPRQNLLTPEVINELLEKITKGVELK